MPDRWLLRQILSVAASLSISIGLIGLAVLVAHTENAWWGLVAGVLAGLLTAAGHLAFEIGRHGTIFLHDRAEVQKNLRRIPKTTVIGLMFGPAILVLVLALSGEVLVVLVAALGAYLLPFALLVSGRLFIAPDEVRRLSA